MPNINFPQKSMIEVYKTVKESTPTSKSVTKILYNTGYSKHDIGLLFLLTPTTQISG
ncbi:hypothetical protein NC99_45220 [Sunxiuqinia dokdonensis]|uniref:Uncharacterized protein n=1 Tax=Sunxiuqinia dokdonensis TaxID=1409788 RepID=A0A0L8V2N8_9BACT|nr:hypothetical protein NC99_45220 [Sunxiuqinia dokdonensis]